MSIHVVGRKIKKKCVKGEVKVVRREDYEGMDLSGKVELIQALIPLGLMQVAEELQGEVERRVGPKWDRLAGEEGYVRGGSNPGTVRLGGQKIPVVVPRIRDQIKGCEVPLESYGRLKQERGVVNELLLRRVIYGLSCGNYEQAVEGVPGAIGLSKSTVSRRFIEASAKKLREFRERDLSGEDFVALFLDGKSFGKDEMVVALGVTVDGRKLLLDFVQTSTENEAVCRQLLQRLLDRGFSVREGILAVVDGSKGLSSALRKAFKGQVCIHRCQWHKRENVVKHLAKSEQTYWRKRLTAAYNKATYKEAKAALLAIREELEEINLSAVGSLDEGLEETLTLHHLGLFGQLGYSFKTTNCLESVMSQIEQRCGKVDFWKNSRQKHRWLATVLLDIEPRFRRVRGYKHLPKLRAALREELKNDKRRQRRAA
jgi:putative transposase